MKKHREKKQQVVDDGPIIIYSYIKNKIELHTPSLELAILRNESGQLTCIEDGVKKIVNLS